MKTIKTTIFLFGFLCYLNGCKESDPGTEIIELKSDFTETEFKNAIIGSWYSVYEIPDQANVTYLTFKSSYECTLSVNDSNIEEIIEGNYSVGFIRQPTKGMVTFAEITINTTDGNFKLSRVSFGLHNALPTEVGLVLRIEESPFGALLK